MAVLQNELDLRDINVVGPRDAALRIIAAEMWRWFENNKDRKVYTVKLWFISRAIYVRDLRSVFVLLFGEPSA